MLFKKSAVFLTSAFLLVTSYAHASTWLLDSDHTEVGFTAEHLMISKVRGSFHEVTATLEWNEKDLNKSTLESKIMVASLDTRVQKRDDHLKSPDFFDAAKFPYIMFKLTKIETAKDNKLKVTGDLTIRDIKKEITLTGSGPSKPVKDPFGNTRIGMSAEGKISRKAFNLSFMNKALEQAVGNALVGDEIELLINAEFIKKEMPESKTGK